MQSLADERANGLKEPISLTQVTEIVQTHFGPLCGEQNVLNVHGVNDEADWRKSALEAFFRNALMNIVVGIVEKFSCDPLCSLLILDM